MAEATVGAHLLLSQIFAAQRGLQPFSDFLAGDGLQVRGCKDAIDDVRILLRLLGRYL